MNYYDEINNYVKKAEIGKSIRESNANRELVECYWNVGRLIVEAQGGKEKAKYSMPKRVLLQLLSAGWYSVLQEPFPLLFQEVFHIL